MTGDATGRPLSAAQLEQRRTAATSHGARSPTQIQRRARIHRRRFLRQMRMRAGDLDAISLSYLDGYCRALGKLDLYDASEVERDPREYHAALNSARLWMAKLEDRLRKLGMDTGRRTDPLAVLHAAGQAALDRRNGGDGG